jgi:hypothetical protein
VCFARMLKLQTSPCQAVMVFLGSTLCEKT